MKSIKYRTGQPQKVKLQKTEEKKYFKSNKIVNSKEKSMILQKTALIPFFYSSCIVYTIWKENTKKNCFNLFVLEVKSNYWKKKVLTVSLNFENQFFYFKRFEVFIILVILRVSSSSILFKVLLPLSSRSIKISFHPILFIHLKFRFNYSQSLYREVKENFSDQFCTWPFQQNEQ